MAITPPPVSVTIRHFDKPVRAGSRVIFRLSVGPFGAWSHTYTFVAEADGTRVIDRVEYQPLFGLIGKLLDPILVKPSLAYMFGYRSKKTREILERHRQTIR